MDRRKSRDSASMYAEPVRKRTTLTEVSGGLPLVNHGASSAMIAEPRASGGHIERHATNRKLGELDNGSTIPYSTVHSEDPNVVHQFMRRRTHERALEQKSKQLDEIRKRDEIHRRLQDLHRTSLELARRSSARKSATAVGFSPSTASLQTDTLESASFANVADAARDKYAEHSETNGHDSLSSLLPSHESEVPATEGLRLNTESTRPSNSGRIDAAASAKTAPVNGGAAERDSFSSKGSVSPSHMPTSPRRQSALRSPGFSARHSNVLPISVISPSVSLPPSPTYLPTPMPVSDTPMASVDALREGLRNLRAHVAVIKGSAIRSGKTSVKTSILPNETPSTNADAAEGVAGAGNDRSSLPASDRRFEEPLSAGKGSTLAAHTENYSSIRTNLGAGGAEHAPIISAASPVTDRRANGNSYSGNGRPRSSSSRSGNDDVHERRKQQFIQTLKRISSHNHRTPTASFRNEKSHNLFEHNTEPSSSDGNSGVSTPSSRHYRVEVMLPAGVKPSELEQLDWNKYLFRLGRAAPASRDTSKTNNKTVSPPAVRQPRSVQRQHFASESKPDSQNRLVNGEFRVMKAMRSSDAKSPTILLNSVYADEVSGQSAVPNPALSGHAVLTLRSRDRNTGPVSDGRSKVGRPTDRKNHDSSASPQYVANHAASAVRNDRNDFMPTTSGTLTTLISDFIQAELHTSADKTSSDPYSFAETYRRIMQQRGGFASSSGNEPPKPSVVPIVENLSANSDYAKQTNDFLHSALYGDRNSATNSGWRYRRFDPEVTENTLPSATARDKSYAVNENPPAKAKPTKQLAEAVYDADLPTEKNFTVSDDNVSSSGESSRTVNISRLSAPPSTSTETQQNADQRQRLLKKFRQQIAVLSKAERMFNAQNLDNRPELVEKVRQLTDNTVQVAESLNTVQSVEQIISLLSNVTAAMNNFSLVLLQYCSGNTSAADDTLNITLNNRRRTGRVDDDATKHQFKQPRVLGDNEDDTVLKGELRNIETQTTLLASFLQNNATAANAEVETNDRAVNTVNGGNGRFARSGFLPGIEQSSQTPPSPPATSADVVFPPKLNIALPAASVAESPSQEQQRQNRIDTDSPPDLLYEQRLFSSEALSSRPPAVAVTLPTSTATNAVDKQPRSPSVRALAVNDDAEPNVEEQNSSQLQKHSDFSLLFARLENKLDKLESTLLPAIIAEQQQQQQQQSWLLSSYLNKNDQKKSDAAEPPKPETRSVSTATVLTPQMPAPPTVSTEMQTVKQNSITNENIRRRQPGADSNTDDSDTFSAAFGDGPSTSRPSTENTTASAAAVIAGVLMDSMAKIMSPTTPIPAPIYPLPFSEQHSSNSRDSSSSYAAASRSSRVFGVRKVMMRQTNSDNAALSTKQQLPDAAADRDVVRQSQQSSRRREESSEDDELVVTNNWRSLKLPVALTPIVSAATTAETTLEKQDVLLSVASESRENKIPSVVLAASPPRDTSDLFTQSEFLIASDLARILQPSSKPAVTTTVVSATEERRSSSRWMNSVMFEPESVRVSTEATANRIVEIDDEIQSTSNDADEAVKDDGQVSEAASASSKNSNSVSERMSHSDAGAISTEEEAANSPDSVEEDVATSASSAASEENVEERSSIADTLTDNDAVSNVIRDVDTESSGGAATDSAEAEGTDIEEEMSERPKNESEADENTESAVSDNLVGNNDDLDTLSYADKLVDEHDDDERSSSLGAGGVDFSSFMLQPPSKIAVEKQPAPQLVGAETSLYLAAPSVDQPLHSDEAADVDDNVVDDEIEESVEDADEHEEEQNDHELTEVRTEASQSQQQQREEEISDSDFAFQTSAPVESDREHDVISDDNDASESVPEEDIGVEEEEEEDEQRSVSHEREIPTEDERISAAPTWLVRAVDEPSIPLTVEKVDGTSHQVPSAGMDMSWLTDPSDDVGNHRLPSAAMEIETAVSVEPEKTIDALLVDFESDEPQPFSNAMHKDSEFIFSAVAATSGSNSGSSLADIESAFEVEQQKPHLSASKHADEDAVGLPVQDMPSLNSTATASLLDIDDHNGELEEEGENLMPITDENVVIDFSRSTTEKVEIPVTREVDNVLAVTVDEEKVDADEISEEIADDEEDLPSKSASELVDEAVASSSAAYIVSEPEEEDVNTPVVAPASMKTEQVYRQGESGNVEVINFSIMPVEDDKSDSDAESNAVNSQSDLSHADVVESDAILQRDADAEREQDGAVRSGVEKNDDDYESDFEVHEAEFVPEQIDTDGEQDARSPPGSSPQHELVVEIEKTENTQEKYEIFADLQQATPPVNTDSTTNRDADNDNKFLSKYETKSADEFSQGFSKIFERFEERRRAAAAAAAASSVISTPAAAPPLTTDDRSPSTTPEQLADKEENNQPTMSSDAADNTEDQSRTMKARSDVAPQIDQSASADNTASIGYDENEFDQLDVDFGFASSGKELAASSPLEAAAAMSQEPAQRERPFDDEQADGRSGVRRTDVAIEKVVDTSRPTKVDVLPELPSYSSNNDVDEVDEEIEEDLNEEEKDDDDSDSRRDHELILDAFKPIITLPESDVVAVEMDIPLEREDVVHSMKLSFDNGSVAVAAAADESTDAKKSRVLPENASPVSTNSVDKVTDSADEVDQQRHELPIETDDEDSFNWDEIIKSRSPPQPLFPKSPPPPRTLDGEQSSAISSSETEQMLKFQYPAAESDALTGSAATAADTPAVTAKPSTTTKPIVIASPAAPVKTALERQIEAIDALSPALIKTTFQNVWDGTIKDAADVLAPSQWSESQPNSSSPLFNDTAKMQKNFVDLLVGVMRDHLKMYILPSESGASGSSHQNSVLFLTGRFRRPFPRQQFYFEKAFNDHVRQNFGRLMRPVAVKHSLVAYNDIRNQRGRVAAAAEGNENSSSDAASAADWRYRICNLVDHELAQRERTEFVDSFVHEHVRKQYTLDGAVRKLLRDQNPESEA